MLRRQTSFFPPELVISTASFASLGIEQRCAAVGAASATWPTANKAIFVPFILARSFTVVQIGFFNGSAVSGNVDVGIYDEAGTRLVSSGSTAQSGTDAVQAFNTTDITLGPGRYYMAAAMDNTTGTNTSAAVTAPKPSMYGVMSQTSAFALPSTATFVIDVAGAYVPHMCICAETVL
jgi:hypothetical protein